MVQFFAILSGVLFLIATLLPLFRAEAWWIRVMDFPRLQICAIGMLAILLTMVSGITLPNLLFMAAIGMGIMYQFIRVIPYTQFYPRQVLPADHVQKENTLCVMISNVFMKNDQYSKLIEVVKERDPDVLLVVEVDDIWMNNLKELDQIYPYSIKIPKDNTYGMMLLSKLPMSETKVNYFLNTEVPSVEALIELQSGGKIRFYGIHPKPPAPNEVETTIERDAELVVVGKRARQQEYPVIVAGDLNDVAWSNTTHLFQKMSGLLDPRIGRGMFATFNAKYPLLRWPLDHLFHSRHFKLVKLQLEKHIGSDHFPISVQLSFEPAERHEQPHITPTMEEVQLANEKISKAKE